MAVRLFSTLSVWASMPPVMRLPVAGSKATCPETNTKPWALMACEYGPMALGALVVETASRVKPLIVCLHDNLTTVCIDDTDESGSSKPQAHDSHPRSGRSDFVESLNIVNSGDLPQSSHDAFQVLHVLDVDHDVDGGPAVCGAGLDVADVGVIVADHGRKLLEHSGTVIAENRELHGVGGLAVGRGGLWWLGPFHCDAAVGLIHQIVDVR